MNLTDSTKKNDIMGFSSRMNHNTTILDISPLINKSVSCFDAIGVCDIPSINLMGLGNTSYNLACDKILLTPLESSRNNLADKILIGSLLNSKNDNK